MFRDTFIKVMAFLNDMGTPLFCLRKKRAAKKAMKKINSSDCRQGLPFFRSATTLLFQKICLKSFYFKHKMTGSLLLCGSLLSKGEEKSPFEGGKRRSRKGDV